MTIILPLIIKKTIKKNMQNCFGEMYFVRKKTIVTDNFFIVKNIRINHNMDAT